MGKRGSRFCIYKTKKSCPILESHFSFPFFLSFLLAEIQHHIFCLQMILPTHEMKLSRSKMKKRQSFLNPKLTVWGNRFCIKVLAVAEYASIFTKCLQFQEPFWQTKLTFQSSQWQSEGYFYIFLAFFSLKIQVVFL